MLEKLKERYEPQISELKFDLYLMKKNPLAIVGLVVVGIFIFATVFGQWIVPYPGDAVKGMAHAARILQPPSWTHLFGTDDLGRDIFSRVIYGSRFSLFVGISVVGIAMTTGTFLGLTAGYMGGKSDEAIMRVTDLFLSIPSLILAILITIMLGKSLFNLSLAFAVTWWPRYTRLIRGTVLPLKSQPFVEAARMVGASRTRIIFRHILPNCVSPLTVQASLDMGVTILLAAALSFLGLGASPPTPEWGLMISIGRLYMPTYWWSAIFPGLAILVTVLGFNLLGDGLRDILDPRSREV